MCRKVILLFVLAACQSDPTPDTDLAHLEQDANAPSGALEAADAKAIAYTIHGTQRIVDAVSAAASQLPGLRQSPLFKRGDASACATGTGITNVAVDFTCLGFDQGSLKLRARGNYPNDNGDYDLTITNVAQGGEGAISAQVVLHVEGLGDDDKEDKVLLGISATMAAAPKVYATLERPGLVASVEKDGGPVYGLVRSPKGTFTFKDVSRTPDGHLLYSVRDSKNLWHCDSTIDATNADTIDESNCRVQEGTGDWSILRF
jgi:hypothetical protein